MKQTYNIQCYYEFVQEYPEYYQVIKKPIDMQKIQQRLTGKQYEQLDDMANDFLLMFDNACKFNEPDSLIYKVLHNVPTCAV